MSSTLEANQEGLSRIATGECYLTALRILIKHRGSGDDAMLSDQPANMLAGFALEFFLKGYLLLKGRESNIVRRFGHKIDKLLIEAMNAGLPTIRGLSDLDVTLGRGHADYTFRYIESGDMTMVFDWSKVFPIFDRLKIEVGRAMTAVGVS